MLRNSNFSIILKNDTDINAFRSKREHNKSPIRFFPTSHVQTHLVTELQKAHGPSQEPVQNEPFPSRAKGYSLHHNEIGYGHATPPSSQIKEVQRHRCPFFK